jgi:hypothetical protein
MLMAKHISTFNNYIQQHVKGQMNEQRTSKAFTAAFLRPFSVLETIAGRFKVTAVVHVTDK